MLDSDESPNDVKQLFELYADDVYRYARLTLNNESEAEDVVQEVFYRAYRAWTGFRNESNPKTWLISIARNYMIDLLRKKRTEQNAISHYEPPALNRDAVSVETLMALEASFRHLKKTYQEVFILRHIEQLSIQEVARLLRWSEGKVRTTDYRALKKLRQLLNAGGDMNYGI